VRDDRATEDGVLGDEAVGDVHDVGEHTGAGLDRQAAGDLLALAGGGDEHRARRLVRDELRQQRGLRRDDVGGQLLVGGQVDLAGAVLGELVLGLLVTLADPYRGGLAEPVRQRQQFERDLLDLTVDVVDEDENLRHCPLIPFPGQMNFFDARNSAIFAPPSPSSVTISPLARGGASAKSTTSVAAFARPTCEASMPASARPSVSTGFFLAAMIPLKEG